MPRIANAWVGVLRVDAGAKVMTVTMSQPINQPQLGNPYTPPHQIPTPYGDVAIEEFDLAKARELDVIFLAVGGDFSKDFAHKLSEGVSQCVCMCVCTAGQEGAASI